MPFTIARTTTNPTTRNKVCRSNVERLRTPYGAVELIVREPCRMRWAGGPRRPPRGSPAGPLPGRRPPAPRRRCACEQAVRTHHEHCDEDDKCVHRLDVVADVA